MHPRAFLLASACAWSGCGPAADAVPESILSQLSGGRPVTPLPLPDGDLTDHRGAPFNPARAAPGRVTLVYFGYTSCPDVCPIDMSTVAAALRTLPPHRSEAVRVLFISTDPDRDTSDRLAAWVSAMGPQFVGLRGPLETVDGMLAQLGFPPVRFVTMENPSAYGVVHPALVILYTPDGLGRSIYFSGTTSDVFAQDLELVLSLEW